MPLGDEIKHAIFDLSSEAQYFFTNNYILPNLNSNLLVLIPKIAGAGLNNLDPLPLLTSNSKSSQKF